MSVDTFPYDVLGTDKTLADLTFQQVQMLPLLEQLQDLKRIRSAEFAGTFAAHRYRQVLHRLAQGLEGSHTLPCFSKFALEETLLAVITTRLGALSPEVLRRLGVPSRQIREICQAAFDEHKGAWHGVMPESAFEEMVQASDLSKELLSGNQPLDTLINRLCAEPRAGATAPHKQRVLVVPQESQAEHCYLTAVTAVTLAGYFDADPGQTFTTALLHHLHNAYMPDAGFAGEVLLGESLDSVIWAARQQAFTHLAPPLRELATQAAATMTHLETPLARVVNAADAIDRVLQTRFHQQMAAFDAKRVQRELNLVHEGPLQAFQNAVLQTLGVTD